MTDMATSSVLQTIFSFFLGLMVTAFVGVGVYTFHPPPRDEFSRQIQEIDRAETAVRDSRPADQLSPEDRAEIRELTAERDAAVDSMRAMQESWGRSTSVILIVFATLSMAVSLVRGDHLPVISNGLLLGGVFTMLYGVGWIVATDTSVARFVVMTIALVITLALGYVRFVRKAVTVSPGVAGSEATVEGLERRVRELEERMDTAASALGPRTPR